MPKVRPFRIVDGRKITESLDRLLSELALSDVRRERWSDAGTTNALRRMMSWGFVEYVEMNGQSYYDDLYRITDAGRAALNGS